MTPNEILTLALRMGKTQEDTQTALEEMTREFRRLLEENAHLTQEVNALIRANHTLAQHHATHQEAV